MNSIYRGAIADGRLPLEKFCNLIAALALWIAFAHPCHAAPTYHVQFLGFSFGNGLEPKLNNSGQIVGNDGFQGFIFQNGKFTILPNLGGNGSARPDAINNTGQVAGFAPTNAMSNHAFIYSSGAMTDLGALPGFPNSRAASINSAGDAVGGSFSPDGTSSRAFLFRSGTLMDLGPGIANAINRSGDIVGTSGGRAVRFANGTVIDLGNFGDGTLTDAVDINDSGQIAGTSSVQSSNGSLITHPFLFDSGSWHDLGLPPGVPLGIPSAINNVGQIVGNSNGSLGSNDRPPFLYTDGAIYNLQSLVDASIDGLTLQLAYDINDSGMILAQGHGASGYQAVLLTAVPEPHGSALMAIGFTAIAFFALLQIPDQTLRRRPRGHPG